MKFAKARDLVIIACIAAAGLLAYILFTGIFAKNGARAEIYYRYELVKTVDLTAGKEESFSLEQLPNVVFHTYADGSIAFIESDCPDKICVHTGRIHLPAQTAACLPNRVYIKITDRKGAPGAPDLIVG